MHCFLSPPLLRLPKSHSSTSTRRHLLQACDSTSRNVITSRNLLTSLLLPVNYPQSVHSNYSNWVLWHICRHIFRNAYYVLGTTSLLHSLGLGTTPSLALGTAVKWVLKDGLGMATKLVVATRLAVVTDRNAKQWRFVGDSLMAASAAVEILSGLNPNAFLFFGTFAALIREAARAMSGPAYRVFLDSYAKANIGEISSRGEAQVVLGNLIGLAIGVAMTSFLNTLPESTRLLPTMGFFVLLAAGHLKSTYNAVGSVHLRTLNLQRASRLVDEFVTDGSMSIQHINDNEDILGFNTLPARWGSVNFGVEREVERKEERFAIFQDSDGVSVCWREDVRDKDVLRALLQLGYIFSDADAGRGERSAERMKRNWRTFEKRVEEEGWSRRVLMELGEWRYKAESSNENGCEAEIIKKRHNKL